MIIKYKVFNSSEEFEEFQRVNKGIAIYNISPFITNADIQMQSESSMTGQTQVGVFITYSLPEDV